MSYLDRFGKYEDERINGTYVAKNWQRFLLWVAIGVILAVMLIPLIGYHSINRTNRIIETGRKVEAIYIDTTSGKHGVDLIYEYIDDDGTIYRGKQSNVYWSQSEAEARIGDTIEIYIDGKGKSTHGGKRDGTWFLVGAIGCGILAVCVLVFQTVMWDKWGKKKAKWAMV